MADFSWLKNGNLGIYSVEIDISHMLWKLLTLPWKIRQTAIEAIEFGIFKTKTKILFDTDIKGLLSILRDEKFKKEFT